MSRLNYDKWDTLELSDDSDIEVHPNIDKKSMIRWKQRDIHEKRELRRLKITHLGLEDVMNASLLLRLQSLIKSTQDEGAPFIARTISQLRATVPNFDNPKPLADGEQPSEDHMILNLLVQVVNGVQKKGEDDSSASLVKELQEHETRLIERQAQIVVEKAAEEKEQKRYITSDDLHMGFESKTMISDKPSAVPQGPVSTATASKGKGKKTVTTMETINSPAVEAGQYLDSSDDGSDEEEDAATLTASALAFSQIAALNFPAAFQAISNDPSLLSDDTTDALLVEAFSQAMKGDDVRARQCVEKGLTLQYCGKLGRDGVSLFFRRMTSSDPKALKIFLEDVKTTSERIINRARVVAAERAAEENDPSSREQIQLVASSETTTITFEVPEGAPPETIELTGEGTEDLDPVLVREFLMKRWTIFTSFPIGLQRALTSKDLEKVNKVLGKMSVEEAEKVVQDLHEAGILSFDTPEIIDRTGVESGETVQDS